MKKNYLIILLLVLVGLIVFSVLKVRENNELTKKLEVTKSELKDVQNEFQETKDKLEELTSKLDGQAPEDIEGKIDNLQSYASDLESSIDDLMRVINFSDCEACEDLIWDIKRKAQDVESDFENLQSEIDN